MAKHLAEQTEGQTRQADRGNKVFRFGSVKLPGLKKLSPFKPQKIKFAKTYDRVFSLHEMLPVLAAVLLFLLTCFAPVSGWAKLLGYVLATVASAVPLLRRLMEKLWNHELPDEDLLILIAIVLAFCLGEHAAAAMAAILYSVCRLVEAFALAGGSSTVDSLRDLLPKRARRESDQGPEELSPEALAVGDVVRVLPNESFPVDGVILQGESTADDAALTGDSDIRTLVQGSEVYAGCANLSGEVLVKATRIFEESAMTVRLKQLYAALRSKTKLEKKVGKTAVFYVPAIALLALLIGLVPPLAGGEWNLWLHRAAVVLLLASPSALLLSLPLAFRGAIQRAAEHGVVIKNQERAADLARTRTMVFGKTGTITEGDYVVTDICPDGVEAKDLLAVAAAAESYSQHPIATALKRAAGWTEAASKSVLQVEELPGRGVSAFIQGKHVYVGNAALLEAHGILYKVPERAGAAVHVAVGNIYWGHILVSDRPRDNAFDALEELRMQGVGSIVMLTGDVLSVSRPIASSLNFDMVKAELLPEGKLSAMEYLMASKGERAKLCYVGDGIHDAALLERADLGIVFHALKAKAAAADMEILGNDILTLPLTMRICSAAFRIAWINVLGLAGLKLLLLILALTGVLSILAASIFELLATGLLMFHALRAFGTE